MESKCLGDGEEDGREVEKGGEGSFLAKREKGNESELSLDTLANKYHYCAYKKAW
jgi:hypothetical protein